MAVETPAKPSITVEEAIIQMSASLTRSIDEMTRRMAESKAETDAEVAKMKKEAEAEAAKRMKETEAELAKLRSETAANVAEASRIYNSLMEKMRDDTDTKLDKWIGYFGNSIGNIVELVLIPGIKKKMNDLGHNFNALSPRKQYYSKDGKTYAEVDLLLENGEEVMVVEVKTQLSVKGVERQIKRLELLRKNEGGNLKGRIIYSAVAGLQIDEDAREMALGLGMYVVEMVEDTKSVNVIKPSGKLGTW
jgi:hypothetical protein